MVSSTYEIVGAEIVLGITVQDKDVEGTCKYIVIGASLSEPHTSGTALRRCVCIRPTVLAAIYRKF